MIYPNTLVTFFKKTNAIFRSTFSFYSKLFFVYINKKINGCIIKCIDSTNFNVLLYLSGSRSHVLYKLYEIIFDFAVISNLTSEDASNVGYHYGINYKIMISKHNLRYSFTINKSMSYKYNLLSVDRRNNVIFSSCFNNITKNFLMSPEEIFKSKAILSGFHPIQACYIGILTGMRLNQTR